MANENDKRWDAAALLDGVYFDVQLHYDQQKEKAAKEGLLGIERMTNTVAVLDAKRIYRGDGGMNAVVANFRDMKMGERWNPVPASVAHTRFFSKFTGKEIEPLRQELTVERIGTIRSEFPTRNPAQPGFKVDRDNTIVLRFDDLYHVMDARSLAALLILAGFEFVLDRDPEKYIVFIGGEGQTVSKATATVRCTKRVMGAIYGDRPFLLNNYPVAVRVFTINLVQKGRVLKLEGSICKWIKKMVALGIPLQQIQWKIVECLMMRGFTVRSVYLDDDGYKKRFINVDSPDFDVRVEFFSEESANIEFKYMAMKLLTEKPSIFEGPQPSSSIIKTTFKFGTFLVRKIQATHPYCLVVNVGEFAAQLRQRVEDTCGSSSEAAVIAYLEAFYKRRAPHLQLGVITPDVYGDDQVNFKKVRMYFEKTEAMFKAMLAVYSSHATRSEAFKANRLDFTVGDGDPFNDLRCEVWNGNQLLRKYKDCGEKDDAERKNDLEKRGWETDPINFFNNVWTRKINISPYEMRVRRQTAEREAHMKTPLPAIGSSLSRVNERDTDDEDTEDENAEQEVDEEGDSLLMANPVHANFWAFEEPYVPPMKRATLQPNPFSDSITWHQTLFKVCPELILWEEWEHVSSNEDIEALVQTVLVLIAEWGAPFWAPAPGYNCLPTKPNTVPKPRLTMRDKDFRMIWNTQLWSSDPATVYKVLARLLERGWILQDRFESGLLFKFGPRMEQGSIPVAIPRNFVSPSEHQKVVRLERELSFELDKPREYLWGEGNDPNDDEAMLLARKLLAAIDDRGVICVPASRYGRKDKDVSVPSYFVALESAEEDKYHHFVRSHVEYEAGHLGFVIQYILSTKRATQIVSAKARGVYLLSEDEQDRRTGEGIKDEDYAPVEWSKRAENGRKKTIPAPTTDKTPKVGALEIESVTGSAGKAKRSIKMGSDQVLSGHFEHLQHQILVKALDISTPPEIRRQLRQLSSVLIPAIPEERHVQTIAADPLQDGQVHQELAIMALDGSIDRVTQMDLAGVVTDMHRMFTTRHHLRHIIAGQGLSDAMSSSILQTAERPGFFTRIRAKLGSIAENGALNQAGQLKMRQIVQDPRLAQLAAAEIQPEPVDADGVPGKKTRTATYDWHHFVSIVQSQIDKLKTVEGVTAQAVYLLDNARSDLSNTFPVSVEMRSILEDGTAPDAPHSKAARLANEIGPDVVGKEIATIAIELKKMAVCQSAVIDASLAENNSKELRDMAVGMTSFAPFYSSICSRLLAAARRVELDKQSLILSLANDDNLVGRAEGNVNVAYDSMVIGSPQPQSAADPIQPSSVVRNRDSAERDQMQVEDGSSDVRSLQVAPFSGSPANGDFLAVMRTQLAGIAATPGVKPETVSFLEQVGAELGIDLQLEPAIAMILEDENQKGLVQHSIANLANAPKMHAGARTQLAQIAVDLYKAWRCHSQAVEATVHPSNPEAARILAGAIGSNSAFFSSIQERLQAESVSVFHTTEMRQMIKNISIHPALVVRVAGATSGPNMKTGKSPRKRGKNSPSKGGGNGGSPSKEGGKEGSPKGVGKARKEDKNAARLDPLKRPDPKSGVGKQ